MRILECYKKRIVEIYECSSISFYISILKQLQYATCLVIATGRMEKTFRQ